MYPASTGPRADEHVIGTPLDDRDVDLRQRQLSRQHHPRGTASGDDHRMLGHRHTPVGSVRISRLHFPYVLARGGRLCGKAQGLTTQIRSAIRTLDRSDGPHGPADSLTCKYLLAYAWSHG